MEGSKGPGASHFSYFRSLVQSFELREGNAAHTELLANTKHSG